MLRFYPFADFEDMAERSRSEVADSSYRPLVDITEDDAGVQLSVYLPGIDPEHVEVNSEQSSLSIRAERPFERDENITYHRIEGSYGSFARTFTVPATYDLSKTEANYKNGVLQLFVPRSEASKPRKIDVSMN